jgi:hypothetical protein
VTDLASTRRKTTARGAHPSPGAVLGVLAEHTAQANADWPTTNVVGPAGAILPLRDPATGGDAGQQTRGIRLETNVLPDPALPVLPELVSLEHLRSGRLPEILGSGANCDLQAMKILPPWNRNCPELHQVWSSPLSVEKLKPRLVQPLYQCDKGHFRSPGNTMKH